MRRRKLLFSAVVLLLFSALFAVPVFAAEEDELFSDFFAALPEEVRADLAGRTDTKDIGNLIGVRYLFSLVADALDAGVREGSGFFARTVGLALLFSALSHLLAGGGEGSTLRMAGKGMEIILVFLLFSECKNDMALTSALLTDLCRFSDGLIPVFGALFSAAGNGMSAAVAGGGFLSLSYVLEHIAAGVMLPFLHLLLAFCVLFCLWEGGTAKPLFDSLRRTYITLLSFLSLLLVTALGFQGVLAASADSLAASAVRFTVGQMIPVVGAGLGGTLRTLSATLSLLKSKIGVLAVVALLSLFLPTLVSLLLHRFCLSFAGGFASLLGSERAGRIFTDFRGIYDLAVATLSLCAVLFLLVIGVLSHMGIAVPAPVG